jgi:hypothetical protein
MSLWRGSLRSDRASDLGELLPLHALSETHRHRRLGAGSNRPGIASNHGRQELVRAYEPEDGFPKAFCSACGSALWSIRPDTKDVSGVRMSAFDQDPGVRPSYRQYVAYAAEWEPIPDDGLPQHPEGLPPHTS